MGHGMALWEKRKGEKEKEGGIGDGGRIMDLNALDQLYALVVGVLNALHRVLLLLNPTQDILTTHILQRKPIFSSLSLSLSLYGCYNISWLHFFLSLYLRILSVAASFRQIEHIEEIERVRWVITP